MITFRQPPKSLNMTTLGAVKTSLEIPTATTVDDTFLNTLIERVSEEIVTFTNRDFARAFITEKLESDTTTRMLLDYTPVAFIDKIFFKDVEVTDLKNISILDADAGIIINRDFWRNTFFGIGIEASKRPQDGLPDHQIDYTAGFLMPDDDISQNTDISADSSDNSFNIVSAEFPLLVAGDLVKVSGFVAAANNNTFIVVSRTATKVIVSATLVTEAASPAIDFNSRTFPREIEQAAIEVVTSLFRDRLRNKNIKSEKLGDHSVSFFGGDVTVKTASLVSTSLGRWTRPL